MEREQSRRSLLAATGSGVAAATAGCFSSLRSRVAYTPASQVELTVKSVPADRDARATAVARALRDNLQAAGVAVSLELLGEAQLLRDVLFNHEYDLAVLRTPGHEEPDDLRAALHSRFVGEDGWQNPTGYASPSVDDLLAAQRGGDERPRSAVLADLQRAILRDQPFVPLASPTAVTALSHDAVLPGEGGVTDDLAYLRIEPPSGDRLRVSMLYGDSAINRNPLGVEYRTREQLLELLYDRPVRRLDGEYVPWLAESWTETEDGLSVRLRPDLVWHDGAPLTAEDLAFTYRFLQDTALGETESPVPAPRFRSQTSLVASATAIDDRTLELALDDARPSLAPHALTVPVLPPQQWRERRTLARQHLTRAIVENVTEPVGSGPFAFESGVQDESLTLLANDEHFLRTADELPADLEPYRGGPSYDVLEAQVAANAGSAIDAVRDGQRDVLEGSVPPRHVPAAREADGVRVVEDATAAYYGVWCNVRQPPLHHYEFRSAVARLLDRDALVETAFDGLAAAIETPLAGTEHVPEELQWTGESVAGAFPGEDGELDAEAARELFRDAGFRYHDGELRARQYRGG